MSYFPSDIPFMTNNEMEEHGINAKREQGMNEQIAEHINKMIQNNKELKSSIGEMNNALNRLGSALRVDIEKQADEAYQRGLNDAWEAAKKIADMWTRIDNDELLAIFGITERIGHSTIRSLFEKQTANEAMLELEAYEEKQNADDEIKVGDEVTHKSDSVVWKAVCIQIDGDGRHMNLMGHTGAVGYYPVDDFKKTGRHFDIDKLLEEMRT